MAIAMLVSIKWLNNHGVMLTYAGRQRRFVAPDGALTVGQARQLLGLSTMRLYRLRQQGKIRFLNGSPAMVPLAELRKLQASET
jgi:hypothetical protein